MSNPSLLPSGVTVLERGWLRDSSHLRGFFIKAAYWTTAASSNTTRA